MGELAGSIGHDLGRSGRQLDESDAVDRRHAVQMIQQSVSWEEDAEAYLRRMEQCARELLDEQRHVVEAVAKALLEKQTLARDEILKLVPEAICGAFRGQEF
jgi:ATP-dependent Zn protease